MVNNLSPSNLRTSAHIFEHSSASTTTDSGSGRPIVPQALPAGALLASFIKTLETQFLSRGLLAAPHSDYFPVWFLVETERNIFLWRNGSSLCEADDFEFWVDPAGLIEKRLAQLEHADPANPFTAPLWGPLWGISQASCSSDPLADGNEPPRPDSSFQEGAYLVRFLEVLKEVAPHAQALSQVASVLSKGPLNKPLPQIVLPMARKARPSSST